MILFAFLKGLSVLGLFHLGGMIWFNAQATFCEFAEDEEALRDRVHWICTLLAVVTLFFV